MKKNEKKRIDELYPEHAKALKMADLAPDVFPTLGNFIDQENKNTEEGKKKKRKNQWSRQTFFCIGFSRIWKKPIHIILNKLINKYNLKLLYYLKFDFSPLNLENIMKNYKN